MAEIQPEGKGKGKGKAKGKGKKPAKPFKFRAWYELAAGGERIYLYGKNVPACLAQIRALEGYEEAKGSPLEGQSGTLVYGMEHMVKGVWVGMGGGFTKAAKELVDEEM